MENIKLTGIDLECTKKTIFLEKVLATETIQTIQQDIYLLDTYYYKTP